MIKKYLIVPKPFKQEVQEQVKSIEIKEKVLNVAPEIITKFDIKKIYDTFIERFGDVSLNKDATYLYGTNFFQFGDLMIQEGFEIRFKFMYKGCKDIVEII